MADSFPAKVLADGVYSSNVLKEAIDMVADRRTVKWDACSVYALIAGNTYRHYAIGLDGELGGGIFLSSMW